MSWEAQRYMKNGLWIRPPKKRKGEGAPDHFRFSHGQAPDLIASCGCGACSAVRPYVEHDCTTREHDPEEWCPDCFIPKPAARDRVTRGGEEEFLADNEWLTERVKGKLRRRSAETQECGT